MFRTPERLAGTNVTAPWFAGAFMRAGGAIASLLA
jgi:hypothetical protein